MKTDKKRPAGLRLLNSLFVFTLFGSIIYIVFAGFQAAVVAVALVALAGVAGPVVIGGDGLIEIVSDFFDALLEGILGFFEAIGDLFS